MVFSDGPGGVGPAISALRDLGRESFAGWPPKGGHVQRPEPKCQPRGRPRRREASVGGQPTALEVCVVHEGTAGYFAPRPHHPTIPSWSLELMESPETSWNQAHFPMKEPKKWLTEVQVQIVPPFSRGAESSISPNEDTGNVQEVERQLSS